MNSMIFTAPRALCLILCALMSSSCADTPFESGGNEDNTLKYQYGESARVIYDCVTGTTAASGVKWTYKTPAIMNLLDFITVEVSKSESEAPCARPKVESFGSIILNKTATDTFSNGNITVTLTQVGAKKSIGVTHGSVGVTARAENGWCRSSRVESVEPDTSTHVWNMKSYEALNGQWRPDPRFAPNGTTIEFDSLVNIPQDRQALYGYMTYYGTCRTRLDLNSTNYFDNVDPRNPGDRLSRISRGHKGFVMLLDIVVMALEVWKTVSCNSNPNEIRKQSKVIEWLYNKNNKFPMWFKNACASRQGDQVMYAHVPEPYNGSSAYLCATHWPARDGQPEAIELLSSGTSSDQLNEWIRFFRR